MKKEKVENTAKHINYFLDNLGLIFITLKLLGYINWSWFIVVTPLIAPFIISSVLIMIAAVIEKIVDEGESE